MIDDVLYCIGDNMTRRKVYKALEKCNFDIDGAVDRILWMREMEEEKKKKKKMKKEQNMKIPNATLQKG